MTIQQKNERSVRINCPVCKAEFDIEEVLGHQIEEQYRQDYIRKSAELEKDYKRKESALAEKEAAVKEQAAAVDKQATEKAKAEITRREKIIAQQAEERVKSDYEVQVKSLTEAAADAEKRLQEHKKTQLDNERLKRQLESQRSDLELEFEKKTSVIAQQAEERVKSDYEVRVKSLTEAAADAEKRLQEHKKTQLDNERLKRQLESQRSDLELEFEKKMSVIAQQAEERVKSDYEVQVKSLTEAAADAEKRLQEHKKTQLDNERLKRQLESQRSDFELEMEKKITASVDEQRKNFTERLKTESELIAKREAERNEERVAELQKQLTDARRAAEDAVRKSEQRSQQLQGEIQELAIEEFLKTTFPFDQISEVKKGQYGADVVQIVRNSIGKDTGIILYESKNTEAFNKDWIDKLKADAVEAKADVLIIVTKAMPKGVEHTVLMEGVWVCPVKEFQGTAMVLRASLIRLAEAYSAQTNKEGKMQMLYDYLTNGKFVDQIKQVIADFNELRQGYEKEKQSMQKIWKKRDTQIEAMLKNTTSFVTEIQVIAGASLPRLDSPEDELLALGEPEE